VLPEETLGWEENPPTLLEYLRRDQRWCQGNLQYGPFLFMPGLKPLSRIQLAFAMLMFLSSPAWIGLLIVGTLAAASAPALADFMRPSEGHWLLALMLGMWFSPKIATALDVLTRNGLRRDFGGALRFAASLAADVVFTVLMLPVTWLTHALFIAGMPFGYSIGWAGQTRDDHAVPWGMALRQLWPHTAIGVGALATLAATHPDAIPYALLLAGGPALSVPFAVLTSRPDFGALLARIGIGRLPEETAPPPALATLALPALGTTEPAA
jgi:membrane glycosyltransferase